MKKIILNLLGYLITLNVAAQDTTFQTSINAVVGSNDQAWGVFNTAEGYIVLGAAICSNTSSNCIALVEVNKTGETIWSKIYNDYPNPSYAYGMTKGNNNDYFTAGVKATPEGGDYYIMRLDSEGDSLWTKQFASFSVPNVFNEIKMRSDGTLMACGGTDSILHVYQIDTLGNILDKITWYDGQISTGQNVDFLGGQTIVVSKSKVTGVPMKYGNILMHDWGGNFLKHRQVFNTEDSNCITTLCTISDHTIVVGYCQDTLLSPNSYPSAQGIMAMDSMGNEKWHYFFDAPYWKRIGNLYTLSDGNILGVGVTHENLDNQGWLFKMSATGELLWEHRYISLEHAYDGWLLAATEAPDGGIVAVGAIVDTIEGGGVEGDIWFIKTDANGCVGNPNNCLEEDIFLHIEEENGVAQWVSGYPIRIAPNPTQGQFTLQYQLPPDLQNVPFQLYTLTGQLVYGIPLGTGHDLSLPQETQVVLPSNVTSGMYFYQVQSEVGRLGSGKLVVR